MKKISVLLAVHNGEKYIDESINSVLNQTYQDFELIICANGCTDNTITKIGKFLTDHPKKDKIYATSLPNANKCEALNYLIKLSPRNYVAIQDADDIWHPEKLEKQVKYMGDYDVIGTMCNYIDYLGIKIPFKNDIPTTNEEIRKWITTCHSNPIINCSALINKRFITDFNGYNKQFEGVEDYYLWSQMAIFSKAKFINIDEKLVSHRLHIGSHFNSKNQDSKIEAITKFIKENVNQEQIVE